MEQKIQVHSEPLQYRLKLVRAQIKFVFLKFMDLGYQIESLVASAQKLFLYGMSGIELQKQMKKTIKIS